MKKAAILLMGLYIPVSIVFTVFPVQAQNNAGNDALSKLAVASPTTTAIAKFTDFPVGAYSGTPDISIPLYTINTGFVSVPVTLSYHAGGFRVNENAGSSGLGWSIMAGGVINRSVLGIEDNDSWQSKGLHWVSQPFDLYNDTIYQQVAMLAQNGIDGAPDLYTYNVNGYTGKFIFADQIRQLPQTNVQINKISNNEYQLITPDGVRYIFTETEKSFNKSNSSASNYNVAWYLSKIIAADRSDSVLFSYMLTNYEVETGRSFSVDILQSNTGFYYGAGSNQSVNISRIAGRQLSKIEFRQGSVEFKLSWNTRQDLSGVESAAQVDGITIKNKQGNVIRSIGFRYDYFTNTGNGPEDKRLRLKSVYFYPGNSTDTLLAERYSFIYNNMQMPSKNALGIDHWGYYNGVRNNTLVPSWQNCTDDLSTRTCTYCDQNPYFFRYFGANRETNPMYCSIGMLERINLPTGGYRQYSWEPNDYANPLAGKPVYEVKLLTIGSVEANSTAFVEDSTSDIYIDPKLYPDGICAKVNGIMSAGDEDPASIIHSGSSLKLYRRAGRTVVKAFSLSGGAGPSQTAEVLLKAGQTYFMVFRTRGPGFAVSGNLSGGVITAYQPPNKFTGGCRLKQVTLHDHITNQDIISRYSYRLPDDTTVSSGNIANMPIYETPIVNFEYRSLCNYDIRSGIRLSSNSVCNIGAGSHIGYAYVKESRGADDSNGYTIYQYTNDFGENYAGEFDATWRRGLLVAKTDYTNTGLISMKLSNRYIYDTRGFTHYQGRQIASYYAHPCASLVNYNPEKPVYLTLRQYYFPSDWIYIDSTSETQYDMENPGRSVNSYTRYFYDNPDHKLVTRTYSKDPDNYDVRSFTKYTTDYKLPAGALSGEQKALKDMQQKNRLAVIEQYAQKVNPAKPATIYTIAGTYNLYTTITNGNGTHALLDQQFRLEGKPALTNFNPSAVNGTAIIKDSRYMPSFRITKYDNDFNFAELSKDYRNSAYIWDYNNEYLSAIFQNAQQADIAFTSFEAGNKGNWTFSGTPVQDAAAVTGKKSYVLTGYPLSRQGLTASKTYTLSYWTKNAAAYSIPGTLSGYPIKGRSYNGWTYYEHKLSGITSLTISGSGNIDEIRLYPSDASVTTYTYDPLIGLTSECDANSYITYYTYDGAGRLITKKDPDGKILQLHHYKYAGSTVP